MQAFGIEIRRKNNVRDIYKDVDLILNASGTPAGGVSREMQIQAVAHALQNMLQAGKFFDICVIRACCDVAQLHISQERMRIYSAAHCIHWSAMVPEYRQQLTAYVLDDFRGVLNPETTI